MDSVAATEQEIARAALRRQASLGGKARKASMSPRDLKRSAKKAVTRALELKSKCKHPSRLRFVRREGRRVMLSDANAGARQQGEKVYCRYCGRSIA